MADLTELDPNAASILLEQIEARESVQREHIGELQKIRDSGKKLRAAQAAQSTGCLLPSAFVLTFGVILMFLLIFG